MLWADNQDVVPELVEAFLISAEILPKDWRERSEDGGCPDKEEGHATDAVAWPSCLWAGLTLWPGFP